MELKRLSVDDVFNSPNFDEMCKEYGDETANPDLKGIKPDFDLYRSLEAKNMIFCSGLFDEKADLIGLVTIVINRVPHFDANTASVETIWARKDKRALGIGMTLLSEAKRMAKENGAKGLFIGARPDTRFDKMLGLIFPLMHKVYWAKL